MTIPILAVDDEHSVRTSLSVMFRKWKDLELDLAEDGQEALEKLAQRDYDLEGTSYEVLISDVLMPRLDGLGLLEAVREQYPTLPVIMLTGVQDVTTPVQAFRLGAMDYLQKPFQAEELRAAIDNALASREAEPDFGDSGNPHFDRGKFYWAGWRLTAARRR